MTSERAVDGWRELRREIEALPLTGERTPGPFISRAAVLAIVGRLAAARGEPGLDVERLARALHAEREAFFGYTAPCGDNLCGCRLTAPTVAAEYATLATPTTPEPDQ